MRRKNFHGVECLVQQSYRHFPGQRMHGLRRQKRIRRIEGASGGKFRSHRPFRPLHRHGVHTDRKIPQRLHRSLSGKSEPQITARIGLPSARGKTQRDVVLHASEIVSHPLLHQRNGKNGAVGFSRNDRGSVGDGEKTNLMLQRFRIRHGSHQVLKPGQILAFAVAFIKKIDVIRAAGKGGGGGGKQDLVADDHGPRTGNGIVAGSA